MMNGIGLSTSKTKRSTGERVRQIVEFWSQVRVGEELGATTWDVLEPLERIATEALDRQFPDLGRAEAATAEALFRISGVNPL
jgi:hypothetical protein